MARYLIATYGAFAIMGSTLYAFGVGHRGGAGSRLAGSETRQPDARWAPTFSPRARWPMAFGAIVILLLFAHGRGVRPCTHGAGAMAADLWRAGGGGGPVLRCWA